MTSSMVDINAVRQDLIDAFRLLYAEHGMSGMSANLVAEKAGYSRSTLYRHFESIYDILRVLEDEALPKREFKVLVDNAETVSMKTIREVILNALNERKDLIRILIRYEEDNNYLDRMGEILNPVFYAQLKRVYVMELNEYDILAEYITYAKLGTLRYWARNENAPNLVHITGLTDSLFECGLWDRVQQAYEAYRTGVTFERVPIGQVVQERSWMIGK